MFLALNYSVLGRRSLDWKMELRAKRSLDEADSRSSDVEAGLAGAVMCETRGLGIKWLQWHTLMFSDEVKIDMRLLCPKGIQ